MYTFGREGNRFALGHRQRVFEMAAIARTVDAHTLTLLERHSPSRLGVGKAEARWSGFDKVEISGCRTGMAEQANECEFTYERRLCAGARKKLPFEAGSRQELAAAAAASSEAARRLKIAPPSCSRIGEIARRARLALCAAHERYE